MFRSAILFVLASSTALVGFSSALPNGSPPKKTCDTATHEDYSDLPGIVPAAPGVVQLVPSPYKGLTYGKGFSASKSLDGQGRIFFNPTTEAREPVDIGADASSDVASYQLKGFDWYGSITTANPNVDAAFNTTLLMEGTTDTDGYVTAVCKYVVPLVAVGTPATPPQTQRCTLPSTFVRVTDVKFSTAGLLATTQSVQIYDLDYVLHKYC